MPDENNTADLTLPSVRASSGRGYRRERLLLTIVYHSDPGRIGEVATLAPSGAGHSLLLGRQQPRFSSRLAGGPERSLGDRYISRLAIEMRWRGEQLLLQRGTSANRCQVDGVELLSPVTLQPQQLRRGVPILLAHSVVLLLRLGELPPLGAPPPATTDILGSSAYAGRLRQQIAEAAATDLDVLIRGETGTGKELVATAIHAASGRAAADLVAVNMAAIPAGLAPAALFGSVRGAFTGADKATVGYFQQADGGTLFLDEVGDTAAEVQPQLLRVLQEREIQVVGGQVRRVNLRVVSATEASLEGGGGEFRAALRHRLGAVEIHLLPLREHPEDVGELWWHFLHREYQSCGRAALLPVEGSPPMLIARWADLFYQCLRYSWPGNIRELANRARQLAAHSSGELTLPDGFRKALLAGTRDQAPVTAKRDDVPRRRMSAVPEQEFLDAWQAQDYEVAPIARYLGVSRQAVYRRIDTIPGMRTAAGVPDEELKAALVAEGNDLWRVAQLLRVSHSALTGRVRQLGITPHRGSG